MVDACNKALSQTAHVVATKKPEERLLFKANYYILQKSVKNCKSPQLLGISPDKQLRKQVKS
jgi:hypothetical protein